MKIIIVEKLYYPYSGIQDYFIDLVKLLRSHRQDVIVFDGYKRVDIEALDGSELFRFIPKKNLWYALNALYSFKANWVFGKLLDEEKPDVVHINNIHHNLSPSILYEAKKRNIPIVYHLHDYKLVCPISSLYREGHVCKDCAHGKYIQLVKKRCSLHGHYNVFENLFLFIEAIVYKYILQVSHMVDTFIASSYQIISDYHQMGFKEKIQILPYFVFSSQSVVLKSHTKEKIVLYFGRIVPEKGLLKLIQAAAQLDIKVRIIGIGSQLHDLQNYCLRNNIRKVQFVGFLQKKALQKEIRSADVMVLPSLWSEPFGKTIIESFSKGIPVIASDVGAISEIVKHGKNGYLYNPHDVNGLKEALQHFFSLSNDKRSELEKNAYETWKRHYNPENYYKRLMEIYTSVLARSMEKFYKRSNNPFSMVRTIT